MSRAPARSVEDGSEFAGQHKILLVILERLAELQRWKNELEQGSKRALEADSAETPPADDPSARSIRHMLRAGLSPLIRKLDLVPLMTSKLNMLADQTSGLAALLHKMFEQITGRELKH